MLRCYRSSAQCIESHIVIGGVERANLQTSLFRVSSRRAADLNLVPVTLNAVAMVVLGAAKINMGR